MSVIDMLRIAGVASYLTLSLSLSRPTFRVLFGKPRFLDPIMFAIWTIMVSRLMFTGRDIGYVTVESISPDGQNLTVICHISSICACLFALIATQRFARNDS